MTAVEPREARGHDWIVTRTEELKALGETEPRPALDPVNRPMIRHWAEAMGDADPRWQGPDAVAPPAMAQVWTMYGLDPHRPARDPLHGTMQVLDEAGYTSVLGTNCDQTYTRFLRPGERPEITTRLESVVGPKQTAMGEGYFVTTASTWWVGEGRDREAVATMTFRVLKFRPGTGRSAAKPVDRTKTVRPVVNRDNAFFFEGTAAGEVRIQSCNACGALRHPPGPVCPSCHGMDRGWVVASGRGTVHSWLVHHAPQVPGKELPLTLALVELEEGVRMVGAVTGGEVEIGDPVEAWFDRIDDDLTLPAWRPAPAAVPATAASAASAATAASVASAATAASDPSSEPAPTGGPSHDGPPAEPAGNSQEPELPAWDLPITPTLVISTALATRDFQDVHHDRDLAVQRGSRDIFLNILTDTGLVQRFVTDWARATGRGDVRVTSCALRLGAPAHPGDTVRFTGEVVEEGVPAEGGATTVDVVGRVRSEHAHDGAAHATARVTFVRDGEVR